MRYVFCICTCSAQLSMLYTERHAQEIQSLCLCSRRLEPQAVPINTTILMNFSSSCRSAGPTSQRSSEQNGLLPLGPARYPRSPARARSGQFLHGLAAGPGQRAGGRGAGRGGPGLLHPPLPSCLQLRAHCARTRSGYFFFFWGGGGGGREEGGREGEREREGEGETDRQAETESGRERQIWGWGGRGGPD